MALPTWYAAAAANDKPGALGSLATASLLPHTILPAQLIGVHTWNGGGTGIAVNAKQVRLLGCYLDYNTLNLTGGLWPQGDWRAWPGHLPRSCTVMPTHPAPAPNVL